MSLIKDQNATPPTATIALNLDDESSNISAIAPLTARTSGNLDQSSSIAPFKGQNGADISAILPNNKSDISVVSANNQTMRITSYLQGGTG